MWFPVVITSAPERKISRAVWGVSPAPAAPFSPLTTTSAGWSSLRSRGSSRARIRRPGWPTTSPTNRIRIASHGEAYCPRLPDDTDLDLPRVGQLPLQAAGDLLAQRVGVLVAGLLRVDDHTQLLAGLDRVGPLDSREALGD